MDSSSYRTMMDRYSPEEIRRMAAVSRMTPRDSRNAAGRLLPLRYRVAEQMVAEGVA